MTAPQRIQRRRAKGWRMPDGAIYVGRPTRWGNPWKVQIDGDRAGWTVSRTGSTVRISFGHRRTAAHQVAVDFYRDALQHGLLPVVPLEVTRELAGYDLACWCPLEQPCHADVLLEIANGGGA